MEHTLALMNQAHEGDKGARDQLVEENMGLVFTVANRFCKRGAEKEDLIQIGCIGLLKAIDHFDPSFRVKFSTYAVPMIAGEMKRFLRDDGMVKVSRTLKEIAYKTSAVSERLEKVLGREPTLDEIAKETGVCREEIVMAMEASADVESLQKPVYEGDGCVLFLEDRLEKKEDEHEKVLNHLFLQTLLENLEEKEKVLIKMRYFQEKTQSEIARELGMSQVQVSRSEKKILQKLRSEWKNNRIK